MRRIAATVLTTALAGGLVGGVSAMATSAPAVAQATDNTAFCDTVLQVQALVNAEQFDQLESALAALESSAPTGIAADVSALTAAFRTAIADQTDPTGDPAFEQSQVAVGQYVFDNCGWQTAEVSMAEYEFTGIPKSFTTGPAAVKLTNVGAEVHEFLTVRIKTNDKLKSLVKLSEKKAGKKVEFVDHTEAGPGETAFAFIDFKKPGRYGAVCFIPVGTTSLDDAATEHGHGGGKPHALEGMYKAFRVTAA